MSKKNKPQKSSSPVGRIVLWVVILVMAGLAAWQWSVRTAYVGSLDKIDKAMAANDSKSGNGLKLAEAEALFSSYQLTGPAQSQSEQVYTYHWKGPFQNYLINVFVGSGDMVLRFDSGAPAPAKKTP